MARTLNPQEYEQKRSQILDAAQALIYLKGYEQITINDIQEQAGISKGAFYHYFDSKHDLLDAMIERTMQQAMQVLTPVAQDASLTAPEKLGRFFQTVSSWKTARRDFFIAVLKGWYRDENTVLRQKTTTAGPAWFSPILQGIIQQGIEEGFFNNPNSAGAGEVVMALLQAMGDGMSHIILDDSLPGDSQRQQLAYQKMHGMTAAYITAIERILGAAEGTLALIDMEVMKDWIFVAKDGDV